MIPHSIYGYSVTEETPQQIAAHRLALSREGRTSMQVLVAANDAQGRASDAVATMSAGATRAETAAPSQTVGTQSDAAAPATLHSAGWLALALPLVALCLMLGTLLSVVFGGGAKRAPPHS